MTLRTWLEADGALVFPVEYVQRYAKQEQVDSAADGKEEDVEESDGFLSSSSDDEEDPPAAGIPGHLVGA